MSSIWAFLQSRRKRAPGEPVVTFVAADGARVELSAVTLENAAAKIGNALLDEFGLDTGDRIALRLPVHWQRSAWLAGAWTAGCQVAVLPDAPPGAGAELVVTTVGDAATGATSGGPVVVASLHPLGLPVAEPLPPGVVDATLAVRTQPDAYLGAPASPDDAAFVLGEDVLTQRQVLALAADRAAAWGLPEGGRLVVGPGADPLDAWLAALAVPLATKASVVLVDGDHDLGHLAAQERATTLLPPR